MQLQQGRTMRCTEELSKSLGLDSVSKCYKHTEAVQKNKQYDTLCHYEFNQPAHPIKETGSGCWEKWKSLPDLVAANNESLLNHRHCYACRPNGEDKESESLTTFQN